MTITIRARFSKGSAVRYMSHLDLQRMFGRALRRAKVPVAYSQGFNPHPNMNFGSALGVGSTSESEYIDVDLSEHISPEDFIQRMQAILPPGLSIEEARIYEVEVGATKLKTLMSVINIAEYEINIYTNDIAGLEKQVKAALHKLGQSETWIINRFSKKKNRDLDIKPFVYEIDYSKIMNENESSEHDSLVIKAIVMSGSEANVRPDEIIEVLKKYGDLPETPYQIHRKNLGIMEELRIMTPFLT